MDEKNFNTTLYEAPPEDRFAEKYSEKSRAIAGVLAILLGGLGIHAFYLGNTKKGIIHLLLSCTGILAFVSSMWGVCDGIMLFMGKINTDGNGDTLV